ncbi:DMT family transporter [Clostridium tyrobutyricum]|uniref:DMT family transporter n=1 Tax=Clostridium tyrobutyricum TaxID=1519 RepID=UPI001C3953FF|nr:DMT family transporter [Clostridium tyrobutyricum]MBV4419212.1 DMT family transporter [Clostridium tyrobutyricum]
MEKKNIKSYVYLVITAIIWGFAFAAQRFAVRFVEPFTFNGIRFVLGTLSLIPVMVLYKSDSAKQYSLKSAAFGGIIAGIFLFLASSFQQIGLAGTTAGKAAFITGLYIVIVPLFGVFLKQHIDINLWIGAFTAIVGLYLLCVTGGFNVNYSDMMQLICSFLFAFQILIIGYFANKVDCIKLAFFQFVTCALLSLIVAVLTESMHIANIKNALIPIIYAGIFSVGVAYTFQILGQKYAEPTHSAIIMSLESVFAALGGFIILGEKLELRALIGCIVMFLGIIISQVRPIKTNKKLT